MKKLFLSTTLFLFAFFGYSQSNVWNNNGNIGIATTNPRARLDIGDTSENSLKSVFARLEEGNSGNEGTYLGAKSYNTGVDQKSFSIEHKFYGNLNNSINFYRGGGKTGGTIGISVNDGSEIARFHADGVDVAGTIHAQEVKIDMEGWADYVFDKDYKLPNLNDVKAHIEEHKHLPGIPSEKQVLEEGVNIGDMQAKLLQKVEELTLYVIQQQEEINTLKAKLENR